MSNLPTGVNMDRIDGPLAVQDSAQEEKEAAHYRWKDAHQSLERITDNCKELSDLFGDHGVPYMLALTIHRIQVQLDRVVINAKRQLGTAQ